MTKPQYMLIFVIVCKDFLTHFKKVHDVIIVVNINLSVVNFPLSAKACHMY
jgi:hypothetical protein